MVIAVLLGLAWFAYYLPPNNLVILSVLSLIVPIVLGVHFLYIIFWTIKKDKRVLLSLLCILLSYFIFNPFYRFSSQNKTDQERSFSIMSYNVRNLNKHQQLPIANVDSSIIRFILKESPDILVIQESHRVMSKKTPLDDIYPYKFLNFQNGVPRTNVVNALFSKYPIKNVELIEFPSSNNAALYGDIDLNGKTIRVFNTHLQSFNVIPDVEHLQNEESGKLFRRILKVINKQEEQAVILKKHIEESPYPVLLTGDFNNTQFSKVYRILKKDFNDSFLKTGSSFGKTFEIFKLPIRIDYILADQNFEILSHTNFDIKLSDHYPIKATLTLNPH